MFGELFKEIMASTACRSSAKHPQISIKIPKNHPKAERFMQVVMILASRYRDGTGVDMAIPTQFQPDEAESIFLEVLSNVIGHERVNRIMLEIVKRNREHAQSKFMSRLGLLEQLVHDPVRLSSGLKAMILSDDWRSRDSLRTAENTKILFNAAEDMGRAS